MAAADRLALMNELEQKGSDVLLANALVDRGVPMGEMVRYIRSNRSDSSLFRHLT